MTYNQNDDLKYAIENNGLDGDFEETDIKKIIAEVAGENDEYSWYWIVSLNSDKFALLEGGCDYTGWDCQSSLSVIGDSTKEPLELIARLTDDVMGYEPRDKDNIRLNLLRQLEGTQPFGLYTEGLKQQEEL